MSSTQKIQKVIAWERVLWSLAMGEKWQKELSMTHEHTWERYILLFAKKVPAEVKLTVRLQARGARVEVIVVFFGVGEMRSAITVTISHEAPDTYGRVLFRAALQDQSRVEFDGMLYIAKDADGSDSYLSAKALMLSNTAIARIDPKLEILANSVKASHGASIGRLSAQDLFYLQSRGLAKKSAEQILVNGFFAEAFAKMPEEVVAKLHL